MKRHTFNPSSLIVGMTFAIVGALFAFTDTRADDIDWVEVWPIPLVAIGLLLLAGGLSRIARRSEGEAAVEYGEADAPPDDTTYEEQPATDEFIGPSPRREDEPPGR